MRFITRYMSKHTRMMQKDDIRIGKIHADNLMKLANVGWITQFFLMIGFAIILALTLRILNLNVLADNFANANLKTVCK